MAWSDAARRAAAEVRRLHSQAKNAPRMQYVSTSSVARGNVAHQIKAYRSGKRPVGSARDAWATMRYARASTAMRNIRRLKIGYPA